MTSWKDSILKAYEDYANGDFKVYEMDESTGEMVEVELTAIEKYDTMKEAEEKLAELSLLTDEEWALIESELNDDDWEDDYE